MALLYRFTKTYTIMKAKWYIFDCNNTFFGGHSRMLSSHSSYDNAKEEMNELREKSVDARIVIEAHDSIVATYLGLGVSDAGEYLGKDWMYVE